MSVIHIRKKVGTHYTFISKLNTPFPLSIYRIKEDLNNYDH